MGKSKLDKNEEPKSPVPTERSAIDDAPPRTESESVKVSIRVRPFNKREQGNNMTSILVTDTRKATVKIHNPNPKEMSGDGSKVFQYDHVFWSVNKPDASGGSPATQADVFETIGLPLVQHAFDGFNSCLFAYGQTGSGKTYTMMGADVNALGGEGSGVTPRICLEIFARKASVEAEGHSRWSVELGYVEVYNERVSDLLGRRRKGAKAADEVYVEVREHPSRGVFLEGQRLVEVKSLDDVVKLIELGNGVRHTAATKMNDRSSRSHAIIMLLLREERTMTTKAGETIKTVGKNSRMNLVDLAGSERVAQSQVEGQQFKEATHINLSLTTLGRVIDMLADMAKKKSKSQWTLPPYRDAKLTFILKDSLGGNSKTFMIATVSPSAMNYEETLSTLRYASRARDIVNVAQVNEDPRARRIRELEEQMANMRLNMAGGDPARIAELEEKLALLESEAQKRAADLQALEKERQKNEIRDLMLKATEAERLELLEKADLLEQQVADSRAQADRMEEENRRMLVLQKEKDALLRAREASLDNHRQEMQRRECSMENHREEWQMKMEEEQRLRQATLLELHEAEERGFHVRNFYHDFVCELRRSYGAMIRDALQRGVELQRTTTRQLEEATAAAQSRKKENDELKIDLKQCEADAAELRRKLEKAESELKAAAKAAMDAADQKRVDDEKAQHHLEALNSKLEATSRASAAAAMEITALRQELDATRREVDAATRDRDATADEKAQLQTALKDKTSEADDVTAALEDLRAKFEAAQQQILATTQSLHVADDAKAQLTDELAANSAALGEARTANEVLAQQMAAAADALTQAQAQHAAALDAIAKEAAKNDNLTEQLTQMKVAEKALEQQLSEQQRAAHELARYDERWNFPATDEPTTTSSHTKVFPQEEWSIILQEKPRELDRTFRHDVALACHIRPSGITRLKFTLGSLHATFYVQHPKTMTSKEIAARLDGYPFRGMQQLYERRNDPPFGLDALALENEQLRSQKDTDGAQINKLQQDNQAISSAFETATAEKERLQSELEEKGSEADAAKEDNEVLRGQLDEATAEKERLQSELEEKGSEADAAKEDNEVLRGQLEDAQQRIEEATAEKERLRSAIGDVKAEKSKVLLQLNAKSSEANASRQSISVLRGQLEESNAEAQRLLSLLQEKDNDAVVERERLEALLEEKTLEANSVKRGTCVLRGNLEEAVAEKERLDALLRERAFEADAAKKTNKALRGDVEAAKAEKQQLLALLDEKAVALEATEERLVLIIEEKDALTSMLAKAVEEKAAVAERCEKADAATVALSTNVKALEDTLASRSAALHAAEVGAAKAKADCKRLEAELTLTQAARRKLEKDKAKLKEGYEQSERERRKLDARFQARKENQRANMEKTPAEAANESVDGRFKATRKALQALRRNAT